MILRHLEVTPLASWPSEGQKWLTSFPHRLRNAWHSLHNFNVCEWQHTGEPWPVYCNLLIAAHPNAKELQLRAEKGAL